MTYDILSVFYKYDVEVIWMEVYTYVLLRSAENSLVLMDAASKEVVQYLNKLQKVY